jgi:predicted nucleic acid-binding protein
LDSVFLDTNYLVALVYSDLAAGDEVRRWIQQGRMPSTSAPAWAEFLSGSLDSADRRAIEVLLEDRIAPFGKAEADCAAHLYRAGRCKRENRLDTFIAATAIVADGWLATRNRRDFLRFVPFGLKFA